MSGLHGGARLATWARTLSVGPLVLFGPATISRDRFSGGHSSCGVLLGVADMRSARFQVGDERWERDLLEMAAFERQLVDSGGGVYKTCR